MDGFAALVRHLKREHPEVSVSIRRCNVAACKLGDCTRLGCGYFRIRISNKLDMASQMVVLIHEWAHVLSWDTDNHHTDHGRNFGIAYAKAWRSYLRWLDN